jgi:uncharacterized membrane protein
MKIEDKGDAGLHLGQNAMVAGDVTQHVNIEHKHYGATLVTGVCGTCGRELRAGAGWKCGACGVQVCTDHYDKKAMLCQSCARKNRESARETYAAIFLEQRAGGIIDPSKRKFLSLQASRLGLGEADVADIEREAGRVPDHHMEYARQQLEVGRHLLSQGKDQQALERLQAVEKDLSHDHEFWPLYAEALARTQPDRALEWIYEIVVEIPERYVLEYVLQKSPAAASRAIHDGLKRYPDDPRLVACRVLELHEIYRLTQKAQDLDRALEELSRAKERGQHPYLVAVQALLSDQPIPADRHPFFQKLRQSKPWGGWASNLQGVASAARNFLPVLRQGQDISPPKWLGTVDRTLPPPVGPDAEVHAAQIGSMLAYLPGGFFVPLMAKSPQRFARFHANQGLLVFLLALIPLAVVPLITQIVLMVSSDFIFINNLPMTLVILSPFLQICSWLGGLLAFAGGLLGAWAAFHLRCLRLPLIGSITLIKL